jgi:hypothetical protein
MNRSRGQSINHKLDSDKYILKTLLFKVDNCSRKNKEVAIKNHDWQDHMHARLAQELREEQGQERC